MCAARAAECRQPQPQKEQRDRQRPFDGPHLWILTRLSAILASGAFCTKLYVMNSRFTAHPRRLAPAVALMAILLMALAAADCAATAEPLATPTPAPELKFEIQTEQIGPAEPTSSCWQPISVRPTSWSKPA